MKPICVQTIYVSDLDKALTFYNQALGYNVQERYGNCIVQLKSEGAVLILQKVDGDDEPSVKLAFQSEDIEADIAMLKSSGAKILHDEPQQCPVGIYIAFEDIDGIGHELIEFIEE